MLVKAIKQNGMLFKKVYKYVEDPIEGTKAVKHEQKNKLKVKVNNIEFDADLRSQVYLSSVLSLANYSFIKLIASGTSLSDAYDTVYKQTLYWKDANNNIQQVNIEEIKDSLELTMKELSKIIDVNENTG